MSWSARSTPTTPARCRFHAKLGFAEAGHFHEVGRKFGRWLDLVFVEKIFPAVR